MTVVILKLISFFRYYLMVKKDALESMTFQ
jgi:hypothetical protein